MTRPTFGGVPDRVRHADWRLVQWVATAKPGDPFPEPWCHAIKPLQTIVHQLAELGVIEPPAPGTDVATIARESTAAAKRWLELHPEPDEEFQHVARRMAWGPPQSALKLARAAAQARSQAAADSPSPAARLAASTREFALRADQLQLGVVVEHRYEVQTRQRAPDAPVEYRRRSVHATAMWRLNAEPPAGHGEPGPDPALDEHYVTRDCEVRVSAARWEAGAGAGATLRFAPTRAIADPPAQLADRLIDKMARTLATPQRHLPAGDRDGRDADGLAVWLAAPRTELPNREWGPTVLR